MTLCPPNRSLLQLVIPLSFCSLGLVSGTCFGYLYARDYAAAEIARSMKLQGDDGGASEVAYALLVGIPGGALSGAIAGLLLGLIVAALIENRLKIKNGPSPIGDGPRSDG